MNHTSEEHGWAKRARAGEKEYQDRYFFFDSWTVPSMFEETVPQVFPATRRETSLVCLKQGSM